MKNYYKSFCDKNEKNVQRLNFPAENFNFSTFFIFLVKNFRDEFSLMFEFIITLFVIAIVVSCCYGCIRSQCFSRPLDAFSSGSAGSGGSGGSPRRRTRTTIYSIPRQISNYPPVNQRYGFAQNSGAEILNNGQNLNNGRFSNEFEGPRRPSQTFVNVDEIANIPPPSYEDAVKYAIPYSPPPYRWNFLNIPPPSYEDTVKYAIPYSPPPYRWNIDEIIFTWVANIPPPSYEDAVTYAIPYSPPPNRWNFFIFSNKMTNEFDEIWIYLEIKIRLTTLPK